MTQKLNRTNYDAPAAPIRLVHLGLGAFHRAHQVWYTQKADPNWGYASFTGRSGRVSDQLEPQDGLYTLVTRSGDGDSPEVITSLVEAQPSYNLERFRELLGDENVSVVTLTVTEAGYHLAEDGSLLHDDDVKFDISELQKDTPEKLETAAGRIIYGLKARMAAGYGGLAVMSCDNVADNGPLTRNSVIGLAKEIDSELASWIESNVTFPSTSIDRITPATTDELIEDVKRETGFEDASPVVTEPFASWVIEGEFPAGRPEWEKAGVVFVDDIEQFERRKLWLLNGSHSLMAYYAQLKGHATVDEAINDPDVRARVEALWDEAANHLTADGLDIPGYRDDLIERFENPRIRHNLAQIAIDGGTKQRMRAVPIMKSELADGRPGNGAALSIAAWIEYILRADEIQDTRADDLEAARKSDDPVKALIAALDEELAANEDAVERIRGFHDEVKAL
ncbi:mannitol dehydrogenase family protein [Corynebacterium breve]|uniref:Mannitol dehydrogenase family protein n=1 Tax=Corynebacterium breve TaxID=3049799 RepID=A0ABY8VG32_9CORY|nr:mannitol dehydrogenase family protein [Corynebacterium breve]WIM67233.1 mannitol dehydrogenase family protein [Corynebacterium breve]